MILHPFVNKFRSKLSQLLLLAILVQTSFGTLVYAQEQDTSSPSSTTTSESTESVENPAINDVPTSGAITPSDSTDPQAVAPSDTPDAQAAKTDQAQTQPNTMAASGLGTTALNPFQSAQPKATTGFKGLKGNFQTDLFTGGGSFSYPLDVIPGRGNMTPALSLQYSTQNTRLDSLAGYGWDLATTSSIFRSSNKGTDQLYTDNAFTASIFGSTEELVLTSSISKIYQPKIEGSFERFQLTNNVWIMKDTKGNKYTFGSVAASRQDNPADSTKIYKWMLEKIQDTNGNTITFTYTKDQGQVYPEKINYTGNGADTGIFQILFTFETRPDLVSNYNTAFQVTTAKRLQKIELRMNLGSGFQTQYGYQFTYDSSGYRSKLTGIQLVSASQTVPATTFIYTDSVTNPDQTPNLIRAIQTPYGGLTTITYKPSTQYTLSDGTLANPKLHLMIQTVASVTTKNSSSDTPKTTSYLYQAGHYFADTLDVYKREYAGFGQVTVTDPLGNISKLYFHQSEKDPNNAANTLLGEYQDHLSKKGRIYRQEQYDNANHLMVTTISKWSKTSLSGGRNFPFLVRTSTLTYDGTGSARYSYISYSYDAYGNLTQDRNLGEMGLINQDGSGTDLGTDTLIKDITYVYNTTLGVVSLPQTVTLKDNVGTILQQTNYYYDSLPLGQVSKGNLTKQEDWLNPGNRYIASKQLTYNSYGLPLTITDALNHTTTLTYDTYNLYPASTTNAKNQTTTATYDYASGQVKDTTDPNQAKTSTTYDSFARPTQIQITNPSNPTTLASLKTIQYFDSSVPFKVLTTDFNGQAGDTGRAMYEYYDGFGQKLQTRTVAEGTNQYSVTSILYDEKNRPKKELLPTFETGSAYTTPSPTARGNAFTYDALDRVLSLSNNIGTTSTSYDKWTKTVTDANNHIKKFYQDAYQNLTKVEEKNGTSTYTTNYTYDPLQRLTKITDAENNVRNFTYDSLSRLLSQDMLHPATQTTNISQWSYIYDDANNLSSKTDPNNQTTTYTYDQLNRPLTEDSSTQAGIEVTNEYDVGSNAIGKLDKVTTSGEINAYTYDILGRPTTTTQTVDGTNYVTSTTYDLQGSPLTVTYPNSKVVSYTYNNAYQLNSTTLNPATLISNIDYAPNGSITKMEYANGTTTLNTYDYDKLYRLTAKKTTKGTTVLQDLAYTFDPVGNLLNITENAPTAVKRSSTYTYDDLDRVLTASITNLNDSTTTNQTFGYSATGNILSNSLLGNYLYEGTNNANPQAVTKVGTGPTSRTYQYDKNGNVTTTTNNGVTQSLSYDYRNNLTQTVKGTATTVYTYDSSYNRVKKWTAAPTSSDTTLYLGGYEIEGIANTSGVLTTTNLQRINISVANGQSISIETNPTAGTTNTIYHHTDHLTGSSVDTDANGYMLEVQDYLPFGSNRVDQKFQSYANKKKFTGKELDSESGLYYYGARYYDSDVGRWMALDPIVLSFDLKQLLNPQELNAYTYVSNNPLKNIDPTGEAGEDNIGLAAVKTVLNFVFGAAYGATDTYSYGTVSQTTSAPSNSAFQTGIGVGQGLALVAAAVETAVGIAGIVTGLGGGLTLAPASGGASVAAGAAVTTASAGVAGQGASVLMYAAKGGSSGNAKVGESGGSNAGKGFSQGTKDAAEAQSGGKCVFCGKETTREPGPLQRNTDHAIPKSKGGTNGLQNAQNTCRTCNLQKGVMNTFQFLKKMFYGS